MAQVEGVHQLHCLWVLWRDHHISSFPDEEDKRAARPAFYETHYEHCVDIIRQRLMCSADAGLITFRWVEGYDSPEPDFNTLHQCRSYAKLLEWNEENAPNVWVDDIKWKAPDDVVRLSRPP